MPDIGAISAGLQSIKLAIDIAKDLKTTDTLLKDAEAKLKLIELLEAMADVKMQLLDVQNENIQLQEKITSLEEALKLKDEVVFMNGYYYYAIPQEGKPEGPFCPNCFGIKGKLALLTKVEGPFQVFGEYACPNCKEKFGKSKL